MNSSAGNRSSLPPILNVIALASLVTPLSLRALDPVIPHIMQDFSVSATTAATLSSGIALTYALVQPVLGAVGDLFGRARLMIIFLFLLGAMNILGGLAPSFEFLFATRIICGVLTSGTFPFAIAIATELVKFDQRQLAYSRLLTGGLIGNMLGGTFAGTIGDLLGWRGIMFVLGGMIIAVGSAVWIGFRRSGIGSSPVKADFGALMRRYRGIFGNPNATICYLATAITGGTFVGLFPFVAVFLFEAGVTRAFIPGVVIAGFAVGGLVYTLTISRMLARFGVKTLMAGGVTLSALQLAIFAVGLRWELQVLNFVLLGCGFFYFYGGLQFFVSTLSKEVNASALALLTFSFFIGTSLGTIVYGVGIVNLGQTPTVMIAAVLILIVGLVSTRLLRLMPAKADSVAI